jgi:hypothetical protein
MVSDSMVSESMSSVGNAPLLCDEACKNLSSSCVPHALAVYASNNKPLQKRTVQLHLVEHSSWQCTSPVS